MTKADEYCFTNLALIHVDGENATSSKRTMKRYPYSHHRISDVLLELREKLICLVNYMLCTINVHYYFLNLYNHIKFLLLIPSQIPTLQLFTIVIGSYYLL